MKDYKNKLVVLISTFSVSRKQTSQQERAISTLNARHIPFDVVDGFDPSMAQKRNELFQISGLRGQYPQFFVLEQDSGETSYVGEWERIQDINEDSSLPESIIGAHPLIMTWDRLLVSEYRNKMLVLITSSNFNRKQLADQDRALPLLKCRKIPFEVIDGVDPSLKERRNELFSLSGIRGQYPQFFLIEKSGKTHYVGDWETVEGINDMSSMPESVVGANPSIITWERLLNSVVPVSN